ncbi:alcohol dehydrogenase [Marasmius fiardii PR-910]|nr:alcohol dehydrogenase [Marasmius fiardii PR-910]
MTQETHRVVRWHPPSFDIRVEDLPIPGIEHPDDAIVKVSLGGLCGSDLHIYRGQGGIDKVHGIGHEFIGTVVKLGENYGPNVGGGRPHLYKTLKVGDRVVAPFTVSCGECHVCRVGYTCRCPHGLLFGSPALGGGQAQYARVPKAGSTLFNLEDPQSILKSLTAENIKHIKDASLLLLSDILPTGLFGAVQTLNHPKVKAIWEGKGWPGVFFSDADASVNSMNEEDETLTLAMIGLGPVGICALVSLLELIWNSEKRFKYRIVAVDLLESRRKKAQAVYDRIQHSEKGKNGTVVIMGGDLGALKEQVMEWTGGVGVTAVLEAVGHVDSLELAFDLVRTFGAIITVGVHGASQIPFTGRQAYNKNISFDFGRCPVRSMLPRAFEILVNRQDVFGEIGTESSLIDRITGLDEAPEMYRRFERGDVGKVLFDPWK